MRCYNPDCLKSFNPNNIIDLNKLLNKTNLLQFNNNNNNNNINYNLICDEHWMMQKDYYCDSCKITTCYECIKEYHCDHIT